MRIEFMALLVSKWWSIVAFAFAVATVASVSLTTAPSPGPATEQAGLLAR
jgi:hypothetical protein